MTALREVAAVVIALTRIALTWIALCWIAASAANAQPAAADNIRLGVDTCRGSNCHGASERPTGSAVAGNEYIVWSKQDKHRRAYAVLLEGRAIRMAQAIGLPDAANQKLCLGCHVDNVAA